MEKAGEKTCQAVKQGQIASEHHADTWIFVRVTWKIILVHYTTTKLFITAVSSGQTPETASSSLSKAAPESESQLDTHLKPLEQVLYTSDWVGVGTIKG